MSRGAVFAALTAVQVGVLAGLMLHSGHQIGQQARRHLSEKRGLVAALQLTDLAIWTEARYTRHPSQADFFSPFQDFPASFDHFPGGSILAGPRDQRPPRETAPTDR